MKIRPIRSDLFDEAREELDAARRRQREEHEAALERKLMRLVVKGYLIDELEVVHHEHPTQHRASIVWRPRNDRPITTAN